MKNKIKGNMIAVKIKRLVLVMLLPIFKIVGEIFFQKKYLKGRWFEKQKTGWKWIFRAILFQKLLGFNRKVKWPVTHLSTVMNSQNILFDPENLDNFQSPGCYFQASKDAKIIIGKGTYIAPNVGLITSNHDLYNLDMKLPGKDIVIGENCWIGMNCVILPGVVLGQGCIVAAGSVVTKDFKEGNCVVGGTPATILKRL